MLPPPPIDDPIRLDEICGVILDPICNRFRR
jgi:hypothetical protein